MDDLVKNMEETIIISLGGSLIVPDAIDVEFLKDFKNLILTQIKKEKKFIIITGGGKTARKYQDAVKLVSSPSNDDLDWIGIASLKLNAELLRVVFGENANREIILNPSNDFTFIKPIMIGAAYNPGHSTDWDAVLVAKKVGAKKIINLSNIDFAYDKDPNKFSDAKKLENVSWSEYRKLIPAEWSPGLSTPFDPTASELAEQWGMDVDILNGKNIQNLEKCLNGEDFIGTKIK